MKLLQEPFTAEYADACLLSYSERQDAEGNIIILKSLKKSCLGVLCDLCGEYMASRILIHQVNTSTWCRLCVDVCVV